VLDNLNIDTYKVQGSGKGVAIVMSQHGIGDDISAMPAIKAKRDEGYEVTVFCKPFSRKIWQSLGCKTYPSVEVIDGQEESIVSHDAFIGNNFEGEREVFNLKNRFEVIYKLNQWSIWQRRNGSNITWENRIHAFAELIETTVPNSFSWIEYLRPQRIPKDNYILFAPDSASRARCLSSQKKLFRELSKQGTVVMFGQDSMYHKRLPLRLARVGKKDTLRLLLWDAVCYTGNFFIKLWNYRFDKKKILVKTFDEFLSYIYCADFVVATDNGVMNAARAFGKPTLGIFGGTKEIAASQYSEYVNAPYKVIKGEFNGKETDISDRINFILSTTQQWQQQHIMA